MSWCEHIYNNGHRWLVKYGGSIYPSGSDTEFSFDVINFCPVCGAKKPDKKPLLWERLKYAYRTVSKDTISDQVAKQLSTTALDAVIDVVDDYTAYHLSDKYFDKEGLKRRLNEMRSDD